MLYFIAAGMWFFGMLSLLGAMEESEHFNSLPAFILLPIIVFFLMSIPGGTFVLIYLGSR